MLQITGCGFLVLAAWITMAGARAQQMHINFTLSPSDITLSATGQVGSYMAQYSPTNNNTNWTTFSGSPAGVSNIIIPFWLPRPCDIIVHSITTNGVASQNTNYTWFDTNATPQWLLISNLYRPAPSPVGGVITN